jgi:hypothetical protein
MAFQVTTFHVGILLNTLQASSMLLLVVVVEKVLSLSCNAQTLQILQASHFMRKYLIAQSLVPLQKALL